MTYFCPYGGECRYCLEAQERARMDEELSPTLDGGSAWASSDDDWDVEPVYAGVQASDVPASLDPWWGADWWDAALQWAWEQPNPDEDSIAETPNTDSTTGLPQTIDALVDLCLENGFTKRSDIQKFLMEIPDGEWFDLMVDLGKVHPIVDAFQVHVKESFPLCEGEWYFGQDKLEDLVDLCNFLVKKNLVPTSPKKCRDVLLSPQMPDHEVSGEEPPNTSCGLAMHAGKNVYSDLWGDSGRIHSDFQHVSSIKRGKPPYANKCFVCLGVCCGIFLNQLWLNNICDLKLNTSHFIQLDIERPCSGMKHVLDEYIPFETYGL